MIIGIDLGTTNSLVGFFDDKEAKIIPNALGKNLTPSIIAVDDNGDILIGETAKAKMMIEPLKAVSVFKRAMGTEQKFDLGSKSFTAEELSALILKRLKEDAETFTGETVLEAVISVPAYFDDKRRRATKKAGELAGLKVERIISEPTAAAISYGLYQESKNTKFLVFDLGGGTFDVSILELFENILEVRAVAGDNFLGGEDFTDVLVEMFYEKFEIEESFLDHKTVSLIREQAEYCKIMFFESATVNINITFDDENYDMDIKIADYEKKCEPLFDKISQPIKRSLSDAKVSLSEIDKVVLIGGATKLPIVRTFVSKFFKTFPDFTINPDEAVCLGASLHAAMKSRNKEIKEVILTDVCPFTLGTEVMGNLKFGDKGQFFPIIERNSTIPISRTERLYTAHDSQSKVCVKILQGESRIASNNISLGELEVDVPRGKAGEQSIDITYTYDINSILEVIVKVVSTNKIAKTIIKGRDVDMTDEEIKKRIETLSYLKIHPRDQEINKLLLLKGERIFEESIGDARRIIQDAIARFEEALYKQNKSEINTARTEFKTFLEDFKDFSKD